MHGRVQEGRVRWELSEMILLGICDRVSMHPNDVSGLIVRRE